MQKTFTPAFGVGFHMGNAFVWTEPRVILADPKWAAYNTTMCRDGDRYVLGFELGKPFELVGEPFTMFFAESRDLLNWSVVRGARMGADRYTGAPMLRHFGDWYYFFHLEGSYEMGFVTRVMRSRNLCDWELSPEIVLGYDPWDKQIHPQADFSPAELAEIAASPKALGSGSEMTLGIERKGF